MTGSAVPTRPPTSVEQGEERVATTDRIGTPSISTRIVPGRPRRYGAELGHEARDGSADVDEVAVPLGARAEHAVGEDDGVRLAHAICSPKAGRSWSWYGARQVSWQPMAV
jgi:hypothetical protein